MKPHIPDAADRPLGLADDLACALDPSNIMHRMGLKPDPWQCDALRAREHLLLNCHRQAGKSTVVGVKAAHCAVFRPGALVIILSGSHRQATETFRNTLDAYHAVSASVGQRRATLQSLELDNGSRVVALPSREQTIRGYAGVDLLIIDEAARVSDDLYRTVRPMVAVSHGQIVCLSTPFGQRGFFWQEWSGAGRWQRIQVAADTCPRLTKEFLDDELRAMGRSWFLQEYMNCFSAAEGLVYPDFATAVIDAEPPPSGRKVGGIDWGFNAPFAAVWGVHDPVSDVLYLTDERYVRLAGLTDHLDALKPLGCSWAADSAGATEIAGFRTAGVTVHKANKDIQAGIAAVTARLQTGRLKVSRNCANLIAEAGLYRYPDRRDAHPNPEHPLDANNHALDALRYLIAWLDQRFMARVRRRVEAPAATEATEKRWLNLKNESLWNQQD